jgi:hypothetical protein
MKKPTKQAKKTVIHAPLAAQAVDRGDPRVTMEEAAQFIVGLPTTYSTVKAARAAWSTLGNWVTWFRSEYTFLGRFDAWDGPTQARFIAVRKLVEDNYSRACNELYDFCH